MSYLELQKVKKQAVNAIVNGKIDEARKVLKKLKKVNRNTQFLFRGSKKDNGAAIIVQSSNISEGTHNVLILNFYLKIITFIVIQFSIWSYFLNNYLDVLENC